MKKFFETFTDLQVNEELQGLLNLVVVKKLAYSRNKQFLLIYLIVPRLVEKKMIYDVEKAIEEQALKGTGLKAHIIEEYQLSNQYNLASVLEEYRDSILLEMSRESTMDSRILRKADWKLTGEETLQISVMNNSPVVVERQKVWTSHIEKVFKERFGFSVNVSFYLQEPENQPNQHEEEVHQYLKNHGLVKGKIEESRQKEQEADLQKKEAEQKREGDSSQKREESKRKSVSAGKGTEGTLNRANTGAFRRMANDNPNQIYGRNFDDEVQTIHSIGDMEGNVVIQGEVHSVELRELRNGQKTIISFAMTDFTDSIMVKLFVFNNEVEDLKNKLSEGTVVKLKGTAQYDTYDKEVGIRSVIGMIKSDAKLRTFREDDAPVKRVELHCHTKASEFDAVSEAKDIVKTAKRWGHPAIAITDHGCAYAFPDAFHALDHGDPFKVIYGVEGYLVDDLKESVVNDDGKSLDHAYVVFDLETTGFSPVKNRIIEIGAVKIVNGKIVDRFSEFVNPKMPIPFRIENLTGIRDDMVENAQEISEILPRFIEFCKDTVLVAHNAEFDMGFIRENVRRLSLDFNPTYMDTVGLARYLLPQLNRYKLDTVAKELKISLENHHRAVDDAECTALIFQRFLKRFEERNIHTLKEVKEVVKPGPDTIKKMPTFHVIILAATEPGRINLYHLISESSLNYFHNRPRIPKSLLEQYRDGLIIGSACEAGEVFRAIVNDASEQELSRLVNFYDYLEIQPLGNNEFMIRDEDSDVNCKEDLMEFNRRIIALGEQYHKPVCATCDAHFLNPEDSIYRAIIQTGKGYKDADQQAPLYLRTTEEMLKEFEYLGSDKAYEVVVKNTNLIADRIDHIEPVRPDKCPPVIENSDVDLRNICYEKAHSMYGNPLPKIVEDRLEHELHSIIGNGFAVMYIIAQKLVNKSVSDGYLVGSRGSVGSSFAATMSGITEVNPLPAHYYCPECQYSDFDSPEVMAFESGAGCDMPDAVCPKCGAKMIKDGFNIPFETFLGFNGDKEPDIDLNFSGEYQSKAHAYTEVIFGKGQTFRAGTVGTVAEKTAIGYVMHYNDEHEIKQRFCEVSRIAKGCEGVRRTSGQHPGGIIVLPLGEDINSFTPVQHPANDQTTNIVTTHFDYHSIDHNLLKLDILGHDDPTMIRMIQDLTGLDPVKFPLDSPEVMSLFKNTSALGVTPEQIRGCPLGALGIPEFGTPFAMQMVIEAGPEHFSDLVRIAGLAHGTDVWLGNAQTLISDGTATLGTAICTRDDIMIYLISKNLDPGHSFKIMEAVRKGKGLTPEFETEMREHDVPDWYIASCKKIKYMFPKAHAAAYVMMAWRIAYCKIFYPQAYYASYFSIRATGFSYELMCMGKEKLERTMDEYEARMNTLSNKEQDTYKDMKIVQEMYARGFEFLPLDIYQSSATRFKIVDGKLLPSISSLDGMGDKAADAVEIAAKKGKFLSLDDFRSRTKCTQTIIDKMTELHLLDGLPQSNQLSLFDVM